MSGAGRGVRVASARPTCAPAAPNVTTAPARSAVHPAGKHALLTGSQTVCGETSEKLLLDLGIQKVDLLKKKNKKYNLFHLIYIRNVNLHM
jgi:hypothetical protein